MIEHGPVQVQYRQSTQLATRIADLKRVSARPPAQRIIKP
jgi:hypothetical protein